MMAPAPPLRPRRPRRLLRAGVLYLAVGVTLQGCGTAFGGLFSPGVTPYQTGVLQLSEGQFAAADSAFRDAASRCESGREGRRALLFLALLHQDPRNPEPLPDTAALMAGRVLQLPDAPAEDRLEAEALWVSALERGADPELRPDPGSPGFAPHFRDCRDSLPPRELGEVPYPDVTASSDVRGLRRERDALAGQNERLARTVAELQAELDRIRKLLTGPDTAGVRRPQGP